MRKYAIVFSSNTGNTALLAGRLKRILPGEDLVYCGPPDSAAEEAELIFVGFWTDKGSCDSASAAFLESLNGKQVFLYGTAGFGGETSYFDGILSRICEKLDSSNFLIGSYMCQGKMPVTVRERYQAMEVQQPGQAKIMLENFDRALSHPDVNDLKRLEQRALLVLEKNK